MAKAVKRESGQEPPGVASLLKDLGHPMSTCIDALRKIVAGANRDLTEHVKWNAPSFVAHGDDCITFNLSRKNQVLLIFHLGAKAKDNQVKSRLIDDPYHVLEWKSNDRAVLTITGHGDIKEKVISDLVRMWVSAVKSVR